MNQRKLFSKGLLLIKSKLLGLRKKLLELKNDLSAQKTFKLARQSLEAGAPLRIGIKVPLPPDETAKFWGDLYFAQALKKSLEKLGAQVRIDSLHDWYKAPAHEDHATLVLRGLHRYKPSLSQVNLMWNMSHPDKVSMEEYRQFHHVYIASEHWSQVIADQMPEARSRVSSLLQCTDQSVFYNRPVLEFPVPAVIFIGNSRKIFRPIVRDALAANIPLRVYGTLWEGLIDQKFLGGNFVPNDELAHFYQNANIVLNDHWDDMKAKGFISNRIFDIGAAGGFLISDEVLGLQSLFPQIPCYKNQEDLKEKVRYFLEHSEERHNRAAKLQQEVLRAHTFDHRAREIFDKIKAEWSLRFVRN